MSDLKMHQISCVVRGCNSSAANKSKVSFYRIPIINELRSKWLTALKTRCSKLDLEKGRICSKHFNNSCFDAGRRLKIDSVPTVFPKITSKNKIDMLLTRMTQQQLVNDIKNTIDLIREPDNFSDCVNDNLQCVSGTPTEAQLWLLVRKHDHLISRLNQSNNQMKKQLMTIQKNAEESKSNKQSKENEVDTMKYIVKCLQEKQATLEEQIEILTAVESR